jgi:alkanesulfonate monooxygenase SsuD/methylene tetrahydromethanopterin reductase-like flavin-dependent oxidoreductase (luciferase family)
MQIGIGLPATIPGVRGDVVLDWARRADAGPFSSLGIIDRLVYANYEPMVTLAAAAGATQRIRLMTTILIAPLRNTGVLAKQAASLDALSGGRLTLGLGVGGREDDFQFANVPFRDRGRRFEEQLDTMYRVWSGQSVDGVGPVGPAPVRAGGPEVLIGGFAEAALRRLGRWGDGFIAGGGGPARARQSYALAHDVWTAAGRPGKPRFVAGMYYALGPDAAERGGRYLGDFYAFMGPMAETIARSIPTSLEALRGAIAAFAEVGMDEVVLWPCTPDLDQIDRLADLVG